MTIKCNCKIFKNNGWKIMKKIIASLFGAVAVSGGLFWFAYRAIPMPEQPFALGVLGKDLNYNEGSGEWTGGWVNTALDNNPYIDHGVIRIRWTDIERSFGQYDWSGLIAEIEKAESRGIGVGITLFTNNIPDYLVNNSRIVTYTSVDSRGNPFTTGVPWDRGVKGRTDKLVERLALLELDLPSYQGLLKNWHDLHYVNMQFSGLGGLRTFDNALVEHEDYDRNVFIASLIDYVDIYRSWFSDDTRISYAHFGMSDFLPNEIRLSDEVLDVFDELYFDTPETSSLGLFTENLSCDGPPDSPNQPVFAYSGRTYVSFQMLQSWVNPVQGGQNQTTECATFDENDVMQTGPEVGIQHGVNGFGAWQFEVYDLDLLHEPFIENGVWESWPG